MLSVPLQYFTALAAALFTLGAIGVMAHKNAIIVFMCIEMMLNSANLLFVVFALRSGNSYGHAVAFFVMAVAASEAVVGLAIFVALYRHTKSITIDDFSTLRDEPDKDYGGI